MRILAPSTTNYIFHGQNKKQRTAEEILTFSWELSPNYDDDGKLKQMVLVMYVFNSSKHMTLLIAHIATPCETIL